MKIHTPVEKPVIVPKKVMGIKVKLLTLVDGCLFPKKFFLLVIVRYGLKLNDCGAGLIPELVSCCISLKLTNIVTSMCFEGFHRILSTCLLQWWIQFVALYLFASISDFTSSPNVNELSHLMHA